MTVFSHILRNGDAPKEVNGLSFKRGYLGSKSALLEVFITALSLLFFFYVLFIESYDSYIKISTKQNFLCLILFPSKNYLFNFHHHCSYYIYFYVDISFISIFITIFLLFTCYVDISFGLIKILIDYPFFPFKKKKKKHSIIVL